MKYFKVYLKMPLNFSCFNITMIIVALTDFCKEKLEELGTSTDSTMARSKC